MKVTITMPEDFEFNSITALNAFIDKHTVEHDIELELCAWIDGIYYSGESRTKTFTVIDDDHNVAMCDEAWCTTCDELTNLDGSLKPDLGVHHPTNIEDLEQFKASMSVQGKDQPVCDADVFNPPPYPPVSEVYPDPKTGQFKHVAHPGTLRGKDQFHA